MLWSQLPACLDINFVRIISYLLEANFSLVRNRGPFERGSLKIADQIFTNNPKALLRDYEAFGNKASHPRLDPHQADQECPFLPQNRL